MTSLVIEGLTKRYGDVLAVDDLNLAVEPGQVFGLLGPNGSGKSTSLGCALGLLRPTNGRCEVLGVPSNKLHKTRGRVAVVFDRAVVLPTLTVMQNLKWAAKMRGDGGGGRSHEEVLELTGILDLAKRRAGKLSLGQTRRLSIAMALSGTPELIVLDEPLSGLDPMGVREVLRMIRDLADSGLTLILSSHRLFEMERILTHAAILVRGKRAACGSLDDLLGARDRVRLEVNDGDRARKIVEALDGAALERGRGDVLVVAAGEHGAAGINAVMVEAGLRVRSLAPARSTLPRLFEDLVDTQSDPTPQDISA
jgi:ABC-2 type transport system ATP-binding protein